jgi:hypothetical protein
MCDCDCGKTSTDYAVDDLRDELKATNAKLKHVLHILADMQELLRRNQARHLHEDTVNVALFDDITNAFNEIDKL